MTIFILFESVKYEENLAMYTSLCRHTFRAFLYVELLGHAYPAGSAIQSVS